MTYNELEPKKFFYYFKKISDIPRGSGNEAASAEYVMQTARSLGHSAEIDGSGNVLVRAKASHGYENHAPIMMQGHLDMVCEANRGVKHDFLHDPIKLILDGDLLSADGTTLGADNGVAVAIMLAVLDSDIPHPELECLFTTEEETGLGGMRAYDASVLKSSRMINLDSAGEHEVTVSCTGGVRSHIIFEADEAPLPKNYTVLRVEVGGLFGGHSGEDIHRGRIGAVSALARLIYSATKNNSYMVSEYLGGNRDNAIPRECHVILAVKDADKFKEALSNEYSKIKSELVSDDSNFKMTVSDTSAEKFMSEEKSSALITLLRTLPCGIHGMSKIPGLVETSSNLAVVKKHSKGFETVVSSRSSVESKLDDMENRVECVAHLAKAEIYHTARYPSWSYEVGTEMQKLYLEAERELFGVEAKVNGIHAGLECGILKHKKPDMDMISIGPDLRNLHSPDEVMSVSSLKRLWDVVCAILKKA